MFLGQVLVSLDMIGVQIYTNRPLYCMSSCLRQIVFPLIELDRDAYLNV